MITKQSDEKQDTRSQRARRLRPFYDDNEFIEGKDLKIESVIEKTVAVK